ncbi:protein kinase domain-containing protein [Azospirillum thermophilum]|nr:DUF4384 domain-containing protein [Azospirillum thermophilum]
MDSRPSSRRTSSPGRHRLGKYEGLEEIGRPPGGATLYSAADPATGRAVTLACVALSAFAGRDADLDRFRRDARVASRLIHPAILRIHASGEHGGTAFLACDPAAGRTLAQLLAEQAPLAAGEAVAITAAILEAVDHAHRAGLVHGLIAPEAVWIGEDRTVRVGWFGLAALAAPRATVGDDLKAVGGLLDRMLAGRSLTVELTGILAQATAPRPEDRFASAAAFRSALLDAGPSPPAGPKTRRRLPVLLPGAALALLVAAGLLILDRRPAPPSPPAAAVVEPRPASAPPGPQPAELQSPAAESPPPSPPAPVQPAEAPAAVPVPPPLPARPSPEAVRNALRDVTCALPTVGEHDGRLLIGGTAAGEAARRAVQDLTARLAGGWPYGIEIATAPAELCDPLTVAAAPLAANAALDRPLALRLVTEAGPLRADESLVLEVETPPGRPLHLQVDYFTADGTVVHLLPNPSETGSLTEPAATRRLGERSAGGRFWTIGPPFGQELLLVLASPAPLSVGGRPEAEPASAYLAALRRALRESGSVEGGHVLAAARFIATAP